MGVHEPNVRPETFWVNDKSPEPIFQDREQQTHPHFIFEYWARPSLIDEMSERILLDGLRKESAWEKPGKERERANKRTYHVKNSSGHAISVSRVI